MKKKGFTLAEVLITLGIIGVVAALTAPALVKNSGQAKIGPSLAKFVNTFETACEQMMTEEGINNLPSPGYLDDLSNYIIMSPTSETYTINDSSLPGYSVSNKFILKDGSLLASFYTQNMMTIDTYTPKGAFGGKLDTILYDIDGLNGKNILGKDIFIFIVDKKGLLIPWGGNMHKYLNERVNSPCSSTNGSGCAGAIADNGWKADY